MAVFTKKIRDFRAGGMSIASIAELCECSIYLVRKELGKIKKKKPKGKGGATLRDNAARTRGSRGGAGKSTKTPAKKKAKKSKKVDKATAAAIKTEAKKKAFLRAYSEDPNVRIACRAAGVTRTTYYRWVKADKEFVEAKEHAGEEAADLMLEICDRRIKDGQKRRITHKGDQVMVPKLDSNDQIILDKDNNEIMVPLIEVEYSDHLLMARLKSLRPDLFIERTEAKVENKHSMDGEMRKAIGMMTPEERAARITELQDNVKKVGGK